MPALSDRILLVDDDQAVLDALCRQHRKHYPLTAACGPEAGLAAISSDGPFAVVVTDFQMPGMSGTQFLTKARALDPDMIRMMLTGQVDLKTAIEAVNCGNVFRFLTKPCDPEVFRGGLDAALEQYRLRHAERLLLEGTVKGTIEVLAEVLALANPAAFGRATRVCSYVRHIVEQLKLPNAWQYETAALLSQIGCVAIPNDVFDRMEAGDPLAPDQLAMIERHPALARDLLKRIPRLHSVAEMIYLQRASEPRAATDGSVQAGGRILAAALDFEALISRGATARAALDALRSTGKTFDKSVLDALATADVLNQGSTTKLVALSRFQIGMVLDEEIRNKDALLIVPRGHEVTESSLTRIRNYAALKQLPKLEFLVLSSPRPERRPFRPAA